MPFLTLFTAPKPFEDPHISMIQRNTLRNWQALSDDIEVVVIGDEPGIAEVCQELGIRHLPDVRCNALGTPLVSSIFDLGRSVNDSPYLAYSNADILFLPDLIFSIHALANEKMGFLAVGQRWDLDVDEPIDFTGSWAEELRERVRSDGDLHGQTGSDYFVYPRACFMDIPDFAVGRAGWDNWMIFHARWQHWPVVDTTKAISVVHQNHDYRHLPGGIRHYYQPETDVNIKLAGGRQTIFTLTDARYELVSDELRRKPITWQSFWREVEIFPLVGFHSRIFGWLSFALFHPIKAYRVVRGWLSYKLQQK